MLSVTGVCSDIVLFSFFLKECIVLNLSYIKRHWLIVSITVFGPGLFSFFQNHLCPINFLFNNLSFNDENFFVLTASLGITASCIWVGAAKQAPKQPNSSQITPNWTCLEKIRSSRIFFSWDSNFSCFFYIYVLSFLLMFFFIYLLTFLLFHSCGWGGLLFASPLVFHLAKPYSSLTCLLSIHSYI